MVISIQYLLFEYRKYILQSTNSTDSTRPKSKNNTYFTQAQMKRAQRFIIQQNKEIVEAIT